MLIYRVARAMQIRIGHSHVRVIRAFPILAGVMVIGSAISSCSGTKFVAVPDLDRHGVALSQVRKIRSGNTEDDLLRILGEPADRCRSCVPGRIVWRYPIRAWNDRASGGGVVRAALLRITFNHQGVVKEWGFVDPVTNQPLPVRENLEAASQWFKGISQRPPTPPRIVIESSIAKGQTRMIDVERVFGQWQPYLGCGSGGAVPIVRKSRSDSEVAWEYYVDRPSPLFIPPNYLIADFDSNGVLQSWRFEQTYPGGVSLL